MKLTTHLHLVPRSKYVWLYTSILPYVFMAWCLVKDRETLPLPLMWKEAVEAYFWYYPNISQQTLKETLGQDSRDADNESVRHWLL